MIAHRLRHVAADSGQVEVQMVSQVHDGVPIGHSVERERQSIAAPIRRQECILHDGCELSWEALVQMRRHVPKLHRGRGRLHDVPRIRIEGDGPAMMACSAIVCREAVHLASNMKFGIRNATADSPDSTADVGGMLLIVLQVVEAQQDIVQTSKGVRHEKGHQRRSIGANLQLRTCIGRQGEELHLLAIPLADAPGLRRWSRSRRRCHPELRAEGRQGRAGTHRSGCEGAAS
mmetsp:Transcript_79187/g.227083  ORF Transcript_79187/g.227083 Transcript_79187/m.227083 type:complete len:232 (+) Transcript_79187:733-1428(+)